MNEKLNKIRQKKRTAQIMVAVCAAGLAVSLILTLRRSPFAFVFYGLILLFIFLFFEISQNVISRQSKTLPWKNA